MPGWMQVIIAAATLVTACGVLIRKAVLPAIRAGNQAEAMWKKAERLLPLLERDIHIIENLAETLGKSPESFAILKEIVTQFRTDSGSSMLDMIKEQELQAERNAQAVRELAAAVDNLRHRSEVDRELDVQAREQVARLIADQTRLNEKIDAAILALTRIIHADAAIASDLAASQVRADEADDEPGAAADAASQSPPEK